MQPNPLFRNLGMTFWAHVRTISESLGYTNRQTKQIRIYAIPEIIQTLSGMGLSTSHLISPQGEPTELAYSLQKYFEYRANALNQYVKPRLMDAERAMSVFNEMQQTLKSNF